jgi:hypothetical protein
MKISAVFLILFFVINVFGNENKMQVFKPLTSTCPVSWYEDMKKIAKEVEIVTLRNVKNIKRDVGIPRQIQSCNTSFYKDFVFEGNVPVLAIKEFLKNKPKNAIGLALPAYENNKNPKKVFVIFEDKTYKEFGKY